MSFTESNTVEQMILDAATSICGSFVRRGVLQERGETLRISDF
jgi:hypothetical protein